MKLTFIGATRTVTGSCFHIEINGHQLLVDCGLFQGAKALEARNFEDPPFDPAGVSDILLTHAHIDHSGLIPRMVKLGFRGRIHCQKATADLAGVMLKDSAHIQEVQAQFDSKKRQRRGLAPREALYTQLDAEATLPLLVPVEYDTPLSLAGGALEVRFLDAGHILGSSIITVRTRGPDSFTLLFSGDLGNAPAPILKDPTQTEHADVVVMESTYGDRLHEDRDEREALLAGIVRDAADVGGTILIPAFAVGRTQEILYSLGVLMRKREVPALPVFVDSPLAAEATRVFRRHPECYDAEMRDLVHRGEDPLTVPSLHFTADQQESMALNSRPGPKIIISASGMCSAGRILHHLKHNLWKPTTTVLFVGYQGFGTLGRALVEGAKNVQIFGEPVRVNCRIETIGGYSAHADQKGLLSWLDRLKTRPRRVFVVHGEEESALELARKINEQTADVAVVPRPHDTFEITASGDRLESQPPAAPREQASDEWSRELDAFLEEVLSRAKTLARDARVIKSDTRDPQARRHKQAETAARLSAFRRKLDRVLGGI